MKNQGTSAFSTMQKSIDQQQAEIRAINQREDEAEAQQQALLRKPPLWRRLLQRLRR